MTKYPELFAGLSADFRPDQVKSRAQGGRTLWYITARIAMNRLDEVLGPENWWDDYIPAEESVLCKLTIRLPDGDTLTKQDAGGYAGMADSGDDDKSGYSDAFKRAAVKFGVARYLYRDGVPGFVREAAHDDAETKAEPERPQSDHRQANSQAPRDGHQKPSGQNGGPPRSGKALFAWTKDMEQQHEVSLLKYINSWAKLQDWPARMVEWDAEQVGLAHAEAVRKLSNVQPEVSAPATPAPAPAGTRDDRTFWQLASDAASKANDDHIKATGNQEALMLTDAATATHRLHWLAFQAGLTKVEPTGAFRAAGAVHAMEEVYANHRGWVRSELKKFIDMTLSEAARKAGVKEGVAS